MMAGDAVTPASKSRPDSGRDVRRRVSKFTYSDKENFNVFGGNAGENQKKSPLPVGFPRKPLNDITVVLQSLDDQKEDASTRSRKPFTRSQNMGMCPQNNELLDKSDRIEIETGSIKKSKGKLNVQSTTSGTAKTTNSVRLIVSLDIDQENQEPSTRSLADKKKKTVTFAEAESCGENVSREVQPSESLDILGQENAEPSTRSLADKKKKAATFAEAESCSENVSREVHHPKGSNFSNSEMFQAEEQVAKTQEENSISTVAMESVEESQHEAKSEFLSSSKTEVSKTSRQTPQADNDVDMEENIMKARRGSDRAREQRKYKALSSRSSVVKFR